MSESFASVLAKYIHFSGNQLIVFKKSCSSLVGDMLAEDPNCGIDASVLCKVIKGQRSFTQRQFEVFASVLQLNHIVMTQLARALINNRIGVFFSEDFLAKYFFPIVNHSSKLKQHLANIRYLRDNGQPNFALTYYQNFDLEKISAVSSLTNLYTELVDEKLRCLLDTLTPAQLGLASDDLGSLKKLNNNYWLLMQATIAHLHQDWREVLNLLRYVDHQQENNLLVRKLILAVIAQAKLGLVNEYQATVASINKVFRYPAGYRSADLGSLLEAKLRASLYLESASSFKVALRNSNRGYIKRAVLLNRENIFYFSQLKRFLQYPFVFAQFVRLLALEFSLSLTFRFYCSHNLTKINQYKASIIPSYKRHRQDIVQILNL